MYNPSRICMSRAFWTWSVRFWHTWHDHTPSNQDKCCDLQWAGKRELNSHKIREFAWFYTRICSVLQCKRAWIWGIGHSSNLCTVRLAFARLCSAASQSVCFLPSLNTSLTSGSFIKWQNLESISWSRGDPLVCLGSTLWTRPKNSSSQQSSRFRCRRLQYSYWHFPSVDTLYNYLLFNGFRCDTTV